MVVEFVVAKFFNRKLFKKVCEYIIMNVEELKDVILLQREEMKEKFEKFKIIDREIDKNRLLKFLKYPNILTILGVRRCGKSIFSWQIFSERKFGYINFDDERLSEIKTSDLNKVLQAFYEIYGTDMEYFVLDEPQNVERWELFVNRLRRTKKVIVTGSNSQLLSGELATALTGRYISFELFPFSFREFLEYHGMKINEFMTTKKISEVKKLLSEYLKIGGLPETYLFGKEITFRIYSDIIEKDMIRRLKIRRISTLKELAKYLVTNFAREITYRKLAHIFEIRDVHTVKNWIEGLENSYLFFLIERFSPKLKEQIIAPKKVYCIDNGIITSVSFRLSENLGNLMENLVGIELLRRKSYWHNDWEIYYFKDHQHREVDFVIKQGLRVNQLIQVTYASGRDEIEQREIKSLLRAAETFKKDKPELLVITWDYENEERIKNRKIKFVPLWKWLLNL